MIQNLSASSMIALSRFIFKMFTVITPPSPPPLPTNDFEKRFSLMGQFYVGAGSTWYIAQQFKKNDFHSFFKKLHVYVKVALKGIH